MHQRPPIAVAIVGLGVRGLAVLERIISHAALDPTSELLVHLADSRPARPRQYDPGQPDYLLLNHSCAYVSMFPARQSVPCAPAAAGPNLYEWALERGLRVADDGFTVGDAGRPVEPADNLPRRVFGDYLRWFYQWLRDHAPDNVRLVEHVATAVDLRPDGDTSILCLDDGTEVAADYVFVTVGQRPRRHDRDPARYIGTPYPLPGQLERVQPSETVAIAGLGLSAADAILALTVGRGGRFDRTVTPAAYVPGGDEPRIVVYSRSGKPYRARPAPSDCVSYPPVAFTRQAVDELRARTPRLDFDRDVLPLLLLELRVAYRRATVRRDAGPEAAEAFLLGARTAAAEGTLDTWDALPAPVEFDAEAVYHGSATPDPRALADGEAYQRSVESWMAADIAHAARGFEDSPFKAATETCREVRDTLRYAIDFGGLTDASLDRFYGYHFEAINRLAIGPEQERAADILTLLRSGVVAMPLGPNPAVTRDGDSGWRLSSTELAVPTTTAADWLYAGYPDRLESLDQDPTIVGAMVRRGTVRRFRPDSAVVPTADVDSRGHPIAADGSPSARIWMFGLLCEGATFYNGYLTSPARVERTQLDTDRAVHELFEGARSRRPAGSAIERGFPKMIIETGLWGGPAEPPCVLEAFARTVRDRPDALAVVEPGLELTYRDLAAWIGSITELLCAAGIGPGDTVGVTGPRCAAVVAAAWAVIGAGATYLPLDGNFPRKRLTHILDETGATLVLHVGPEPDLPAERTARIPEWSQVRPRAGSGLDAVACRPEAPVYIIYTSGSTGRPKGVVVPHRCVDNMAHWQRGRSVRPDLRTAQFAPLNFDIWFQETLSTQVGGGALVIMPETLRQDPIELMDWLARERIERLFLPCVALHMLATAATASDSVDGLALREINVAGEQLVCTPAIRDFFGRLPRCRLDNHYGQSESHTVSSHILTGPSGSWPDLAPIGRPLPGCEILLDTEPGDSSVGELLVAGLPLTLGYLKQPELTAQKYVPVAPTAHGNTTAFRTGDLVSVEDGTMAFLGRVDDEVKIRGYRVNPREVEACLGKQPGVVEAVCVSVSLGVGSRQLRAAVTVAAGSEFDPDVALAAMREELPAYMVPPFVTVLANLPRTSSGKADRAVIARQLGPAPRRSDSAEGSSRVR